MAAEAAEAPVAAESPLAILQAVAHSAPSSHFLPMLAGEIISVLKQSPELSAPYLYAVAQHLPTENLAISSAAAAPAAVGNRATTASREGDTSQYVSTLLDAIGVAVSKCQPRTVISESGILAVLSQQQPQPSLLHPLHVEFLQACIFAEQYSFAESHVCDSWPRPSSLISVTHVLRYYYLRGCVHMACGSKRLAVRCFWTCLSIPGDAVSAIQIAAWKKMVLVQCLRLSSQGYVSDPLDPLAYPKTASDRLNRLINLALSMKPPIASNEPEDNPETVHMVEAPATIGDEDDPIEADGATTEKADEKKSQAVTMSVYGYLAKDFVNVDCTAFARAVLENEAVFVEDGNFGMVQQCQQALIRRQLYQLSSFYSVIPLQRLGEMLKLDESATRCLLLKLAVDHGWEIGIQDTEEGAIITLPPIPCIDTESSATDMMELALLVRELDVSIATSSKYASIVRKRKQQKQPRKVIETGSKGN